MLQPLPNHPLLLQEIIMNRRLAGVVIGTGGTNVSRIRRESKAKVHVAQVRSGDVQGVELTGTEKQVGARPPEHGHASVAGRGLGELRRGQQRAVANAASGSSSAPSKPIARPLPVQVATAVAVIREVLQAFDPEYKIEVSAVLCMHGG